jgi:hypothetical protein
MSPVKDRRPQFTQIDQDVLPSRESVLGYVKVGGLDETVRWSRAGRPWLPPTRYTDPVRFEVTTRERRVIEVTSDNQKTRGQKFRVEMGYARDKSFHEKVGENPSEVSIRFMFPHWNQNLVTFFGCHDGKRWVCTGNGKEGLDHQRGKVTCSCPRLKQHEGDYPREMMPKETPLLACKPHATMSFLLPESNLFGGFWEYKTTSWESAANLRTQLQVFEAMFGRLDLPGLKFALKAYPASKRFDAEGQGGMTTQPIVTLVLLENYDTARQIAATSRLELEAIEEGRLLTPGAPDPERHIEVVMGEMEEEAGAIGSEFYHENLTDSDPEEASPPSPPVEEEENVVDGEYEIEGEDDGEGDLPPGLVPEEIEETARQVLKLAEWAPEKINARIEFHRAGGSWGRLADILREGFPDHWTRVTGEILGEDSAQEPEDGLS